MIFSAKFDHNYRGKIFIKLFQQNFDEKGWKNCENVFQKEDSMLLNFFDCNLHFFK